MTDATEKGNVQEMMDKVRSIAEPIREKNLNLHSAADSDVSDWNNSPGWPAWDNWNNWSNH
ncbi:hypothetical protein PH5382_03887 [Phaeobacter sp. CECT 5382]|uniref:hypothetical protein n=1 Tax=Phaeobacter sp. CECT 5382 TaxID=1712645 RepID=UPI0006DBD5D3|nr:hypothetical protein [Phaeobacter sp. CECT 5382]CUH89932.1 hypothetical protein PH5382_03887 [Phaeobacter sp. CECT 5382]